ncbi:N-acetyltransferase [Pseudomonas sp. Marseille-QA0892]
MVRDFETTDMDAVLRIWLDASLHAHPFVRPQFWQDQVANMRECYIPDSHTRVVEHENSCAGFSCVHGVTLAALFVAPVHQGKGLGALLMADAKRERNSLELAVYVQNKRAVEFYEQQGFRALQQRVDQHIGEAEWIMRWDR